MKWKSPKPVRIDPTWCDVTPVEPEGGREKASFQHPRLGSQRRIHSSTTQWLESFQLTLPGTHFYGYSLDVLICGVYLSHVFKSSSVISIKDQSRLRGGARGEREDLANIGTDEIIRCREECKRRNVKDYKYWIESSQFKLSCASSWRWKTALKLSLSFSHACCHLKRTSHEDLTAGLTAGYLPWFSSW